MNDPRLDAKLVAADNRRSDDTNTFVTTTMKKIRILHAADSIDPKPTNKWSAFLRLTHAHKFAFGVIAAVMVSTIAFTGYAYAIGSDPISLIKRWIEGDTVKIEYDGRQFEHGTGRNYSDAAVTAYAEVNTVHGLAFRAKNDMQVPKDGIEYVGLPPSMDPARAFQYPYFATIKAMSDGNVTLHKQYTWGNKMDPSHDLDETVTMPLDDFRYFAKGEPVAVNADAVGKLIMVFPETSIRHDIATNAATKATTYFGFALSHDLAAFKEASMTTKPSSDPKQHVIYEPSWGGLSNLCLNNGADTCNLDNFSKETNQGLYVVQKGTVRGMNNYNPAAGSYYNTESGDDSDVIARNIQGRIIAIDDQAITVKTSSGAEWKLSYDSAKRAEFDRHYGRALAIGDHLAGQVLQSIYNLNSRTVENQNVASLERYQ